MLPPRSLIWKVTTASAIHIMAKTPLKTNERWSSRALIERRKDKSRQKSSGPLKHLLARRASKFTFVSNQAHPPKHTKDPNPSTPRSSHPAAQHPHQATFPQSPSTAPYSAHPPQDYPPRRAPRLPYRRLGSACRPASTSATAPGASSPRRPAGRGGAFPTRFRRGC